jgi:hypothetical protein
MESNMQIIGGIVAYEDGVKTVAGDQFSPTRKVRVELNFSLDESGDDQDAAVAAVLTKAQAFVNSKLGLKVPTAAVQTHVTDLAPKPGELTRETTTVAPKKAPARTPTAKPEPKAPANDKERLAATAGLSDALTTSTEAATPIADAMAEENNSLDDLLGDTAKEITDKELDNIIQNKMIEINSPENPGGVRIRALVAPLLDDKTKPPNIRDIPQSKRASFVEALKALKK